MGFRLVPHDYAKEINKGQERIEILERWTLSGPEYLAYVHYGSAWKNLRTLVRVRAKRPVSSHRRFEDRFYIPRLEGNAKLALGASHRHWGIGGLGTIRIGCSTPPLGRARAAAGRAWTGEPGDLAAHRPQLAETGKKRPDGHPRQATLGRLKEPTSSRS